MNNKLAVSSQKNEHIQAMRRSQLTYEIFLQGKWRVPILWNLRHGPVRIGQLGRLLPGASKKVIAHQLRRLEADGVIVREDLSDTMLHVEYKLSDKYENLVCELLDSLSESGAVYLAQGCNQVRVKSTSIDSGMLT